MSTPYTKILSGPNGLSMDASGRQVFPISWPAMSVIHRLAIAQTGGPALHSIRATFFSSKKVLLGAGSTSSGGDDPDGVYAPAPELFEVIPPQSNDAIGDRSDLLRRFWETGYPYVNQDGSPSNREALIYLQIECESASGPGPVTFDVAIGGHQVDY